MDEFTPHMHFAFVPVVCDKKKGIEKVSAKIAIDRQDLRTFHQDLSSCMEQMFMRDIGILNEATKGGNQTVDELKRIDSLKRQISTLEHQVNMLREQKSIVDNELSTAIAESREKAGEILQDAREKEAVIIAAADAKADGILLQSTEEGEIATQRLFELSDGIESLETEKTTLEGQIKAFAAKLSGKGMGLREIDAIHPQKTLVGSIKNISVEEIEKLKTTAAKYHTAKEKLQTLQVIYIRGIMANPAMTPEKAIAIGEKHDIPKKLTMETIRECQREREKPILRHGDIGKVDRKPMSVEGWKKEISEMRKSERENRTASNGEKTNVPPMPKKQDMGWNR
jgi:cell division septum initiation protein DivIVA